MALVLGPEGVGRFGDSNGIFPDQTFAVWHALPGLLINVMSASLLLGEQLPAPRKIWRISGSHVIMAGIMSAGQFAVAGLLVWAVLEPGFVMTVGLTILGMRRAVDGQSAFQSGP